MYTHLYGVWKVHYYVVCSYCFTVHYVYILLTFLLIQKCLIIAASLSATLVLATLH